jgi:hypothetical protein
VKEPTRLRDQGGLGAHLLRSAQRGPAPVRAWRRAHVALGLALLATQTATATATASVAVVLSAALKASAVVGVVVLVAAAAVRDTSSTAAVRSVTGRGAAATGETATVRGGVTASRGRSTPVSPPAVAQPVVAAPAASVVAEVPAEPPPAAVTPLAAALGSSAHATARPASPRAESMGGAEPSASRLADELRDLEEAKRALEDGVPGEALEGLARYQQRYPQGELAPEAEALRIEALTRAGERAAAASRASAFVAAHPESPLVDRVRAVVER